ncbi:nuclease [Sphingomonas sp. Leaf230]|nr:nuclease [Sphingomonas sp. Leaf230]
MRRVAIVGFAIIGLAASADAQRWTPPSRPLPIEQTTGVPTSIYDGDTFRFGKMRVRIWGIDAPEKDTRFGPGARAQLVQLVAGRPVQCRGTGQRNYDRIVAQCWNWQGVEIAAAMVRTGWAVDWARFSQGRYQPSQQAAQRAHAGMYRYGVQPWRDPR